MSSDERSHKSFGGVSVDNVCLASRDNFQKEEDDVGQYVEIGSAIFRQFLPRLDDHGIEVPQGDLRVRAYRCWSLASDQIPKQYHVKWDRDAPRKQYARDDASHGVIFPATRVMLESQVFPSVASFPGVADAGWTLCSKLLAVTKDKYNWLKGGGDARRPKDPEDDEARVVIWALEHKALYDPDAIFAHDLACWCRAMPIAEVGDLHRHPDTEFAVFFAIAALERYIQVGDVLDLHYSISALEILSISSTYGP